MQNKQNQTEATWLAKSHQKGTGIFLVPDLDSPLPKVIKKVLLEDITYQECSTRGALCLAFKWVPNAIEEYTTLTEKACGQACIDTCVEFGCICYDALCRTTPSKPLSRK